MQKSSIVDAEIPVSEDCETDGVDRSYSLSFNHECFEPVAHSSWPRSIVLFLGELQSDVDEKSHVRYVISSSGDRYRTCD